MKRTLFQYLHLLLFKFFLIFRSLEHERFRHCGVSPLNAGDHIRAVKPVGFEQVSLGVMGRMVRMGMIKTDNVLSAAACQLRSRKHLLRTNAVARLWVFPHVIAGEREGYGAVSIRQSAQKNSTAFPGVAALRLPEDQVVIGLADPQHSLST